MKQEKMKNYQTISIAIFVWLALACAGTYVFMKYENTPGRTSAAPVQWPEALQIQHDALRPTLLVFLHPQCPCSKATAQEFEQMMLLSPNQLSAYVFFIRPASFPSDWAKTTLWHQVSKIPGVTVFRDDEGKMAQAFGAMTSGQTILYDPKGKLIFQGGITGARGHVGMNPGERSITSFLQGKSMEARQTSVFGCPLFHSKDLKVKGVTS